MNYLITGATGFIGKNIFLELINNHKIIAVSRQDKPEKYKKIKNITWIKHDLSKNKILFKKKTKIDCIIHCLGNHDYKKEKDLISANENSLINLLDSVGNNFQKFIFISSHTIFGDVNKTNISENTKSNKIINSYACSKINSENWIRLYSNLYQNKSFTILRFTGFIEGKGLVKYIISQAIHNKTIKLYNSGKLYRDYLNIENAIQSIKKAIKHSKKGIKCYNIGSGQLITTYKLAKIIVNKLESKSKIINVKTKGYLENFVFNIDNAKKNLNYRPKKLSQIVLDYVIKKI